MTPASSLGRALRKIEAELRDIRERACAEHPIDPHDLKCVEIMAGCQAELCEKGLVE